ncbi:thioredoxin family protein [bacterium]|nr:thioredoxin family protein [bacterium]
MKRTTIAMMLFAALLIGSVPALALDLGAAIPMADKEMKATDGSMVSVESVAGEKGTLVVFSCVHCPYVKAWDDRMAAIANDAKKAGFGVIFINSNSTKKSPGDGLEQMAEQAKKQGYGFPYVHDANSEMAVAFGATRTPEAFLFDGTGKLAYHGTIDDNAQEPDAVEATYLKDAVMSLSEGNSIKMAETKAIGCSIKFAS